MARTIPGQLDLFAGAADTTPAPLPAPRSGYGGKADLVIEVLDEVHNGRYGRLDGTDRVVHLDGDGHCRHAPDGLCDVVESLLAQRFVKLDSPAPVRHGVIVKTVYPLKLTPGGLGLLRRSTMLRTRTPR
ncbi:hypothetical protein ACWEIJ_42970 [Lentzea sp. NPDC004789]